MTFQQFIRHSRTGCLVAVFVAGPTLAGQTQPPPPPGQVTRPPLVIASLDGHDLYDFYCASCHGKTGHGDGPTAKNLKAAPPDLTLLSARNRGQFPKDRVQAILTGEQLSPSHASKTMPLWGVAFKFLDPDDQRAKIRVSNLIAYLESLQVK